MLNRRYKDNVQGVFVFVLIIIKKKVDIKVTVHYAFLE